MQPLLCPGRDWLGTLQTGAGDCCQQSKTDQQISSRNL